MFHFLIVLYGLSLVEAYNIKITGQLELGKELSNIYRELYSEFGGVIPPAISNSRLPGSTEDAAKKEYKSNKLNNNGGKTGRNLTVLEKLVQNEHGNVHLYGKHKLKGANDGGPLNNVYLRSEK